ncbi:DUF3040 domain-containing protein [Arthrobacter castelli]|uniref:DUF3040 domain-containing protein n=1 Tax=Arthrobacter castelli TaxID=271431 RepID=UPI000686D380|nr:DUF3040 domain-containing protein [Arthrobacter castelli]
MSESLSDHEKRQLAELEQQLEADDPQLAVSLSEEGLKRSSGRHILLGLLLVIAGIAALVVSIATSTAFVGVLALMVITGGVSWVVYRGFGAGGRSRDWLKALLGRRGGS